MWHFLSFLVKRLEDILEHTLHNGRLKTLFCKKAFETLIMIIVNFSFLYFNSVAFKQNEKMLMW